MRLDALDLLKAAKGGPAEAAEVEDGSGVPVEPRDASDRGIAELPTGEERVVGRTALGARIGSLRHRDRRKQKGRLSDSNCHRRNGNRRVKNLRKAGDIGVRGGGGGRKNCVGHRTITIIVCIMCDG